MILSRKKISKVKDSRNESESELKPDLSKDNSEIDDNETDQVDFPLREDLSEFQDGSQNARYKVDKIDFDLTELDVESAELSESNSHAVNVLKPFSRQVSLNLDKLADKGFITPSTANTLLSNSFRMIKRPILNIARGKGDINPRNPNLIMITSSVSGEGKSYTAVNLAISIAMEPDKHVMLIDADVNKPSHHQIFDVDAKYGLTDLLRNRAKDMSEVVYKTSIPSLSLMMAGTLGDNATELLASQAMEDFADEISGRYTDRIVIFDSPPLLLTTEASVLAPHMGQVVLVVEAEKTLKHQVDKSLSLLRNDVVLLMLNKARVKGDEGAYGYYGYGHTS